MKLVYATIMYVKDTRVQTKEKKHQLIIGALEVREFSPQVKKVVSLS